MIKPKESYFALFRNFLCGALAVLVPIFYYSFSLWLDQACNRSKGLRCNRCSRPSCSRVSRFYRLRRSSYVTSFNRNCRPIPYWKRKLAFTKTKSALPRTPISRKNLRSWPSLTRSGGIFCYQPGGLRPEIKKKKIARSFFLPQSQTRKQNQTTPRRPVIPPPAAAPIANQPPPLF